MHSLFPETKNKLLPWEGTKMLNDDCAKYISALAHEVRNPLTNINLSVGMLHNGAENGELKKYLDIITRSSTQINTLINELLKYQMAEEMPKEEHSVRELLNESLIMMEDRITLKNIWVRKNFMAQDYKIFVNKAKMKIALTNILINAVEAMSPEEGELQLATNLSDGKCLIEIKDNGVGISEKNLKRIFDPYFTSKIGGMGLGLSTTLDFLLSNHAGVDVQSEEGKGTCVILSFDPVS